MTSSNAKIHTALHSSAHAVFALNYHLVLVVKYRRPAINSVVLSLFRSVADTVAKAHQVQIRECNGEPDHLHLLLSATPDVRLSDFIRSLKSATSRVIRREVPEVRRWLWGDAFWSPAYCLISAGGAPLDVLRNYIEQQGGVREAP